MTDLWQGTRVTPNPHLQLLTSDQALLPGPSAALLLYDPAHTLEALQAQADSFGLALIRPASLTSAGEEAKEAQGDGYWTGDVRLLKALRQGQPDWQLIGLAQDRHGAMVMGEAGADLILFTVFDPGTDLPRLLPGDRELAQWWCTLFEVPCALVLADQPDPDAGFGEEGRPEFFAI